MGLIRRWVETQIAGLGPDECRRGEADGDSERHAHHNAAPAAIVTMSEAEAQTQGMERRGERRTGRHVRRRRHSLLSRAVEGNSAIMPSKCIGLWVA